MHSDCPLQVETCYCSWTSAWAGAIWASSVCAGGPDEAAGRGRGGGASVGGVQRVSLLRDVSAERRGHQRNVSGVYEHTHTHTHAEGRRFERLVFSYSVVLLVHHRHVRERREASGVRGQRGLHQRAGRHHPTHPEQQRLLGYAGSQTWCHTVSRERSTDILNLSYNVALTSILK